MLALRTIVPVSHIVYGTDYPYRTFAWTQQMLADGKVFDARELQAIAYGNAVKLL
jgi:predicted TIM-barrel fold metal-dependent hydrolase